MTTFSTYTETPQGQAHVSTKSKWMYFVTMPHTGILPHPCIAGDLKRLGTFIKWTTDDPTILARLHKAIVRLVKEVGVSGLVEIAQSAKMAEGMGRTLGGCEGSLREILRMAEQDGVQFPMPDEVVRYVKGFQ